MRTIRMISAPALALVVLALLAPGPAFGQTGNITLTSDTVIGVPATDQQLVRVTVGNPYFAAEGDTSEAHVDFYLKVQSIDGESTATIAPGASYTYTLDPRVAGQLVDPRAGLRHVRVSFRVEVKVPEGTSMPQPAVTVEVLNARTGQLMSFYAYPGFTGGVRVAAGDVN